MKKRRTIWLTATRRNGNWICQLAASGSLCLLLTGCMVLPIPHKEWLAPPATGRVVDAVSGQPVDRARIIRAEPQGAVEEARTDSDGRFALEGLKKLRWFYVDRVARVSFRLEAIGYETFVTNRSGGAFKKDLTHSLGDVRLRRE